MNQWLETALHFFDGRKFLGNTLVEWSLAGVIFAVCFVGLILIRTILQKIFRKRLQSNPNDVNLLLYHLVGKTYFLIILFISLHIGAINLELTDRVQKILTSTLILNILLQFIFWGNQLIEFMITRLLKTRERRLGASDPSLVTITPMIRFLGRLVLATVIFLLALDNLGVNISALLTGLGVGGIAVALAVQNILGDLFASLSIALDKPFEVGDAISVNNESGVVERIGLRTTRVRSTNGQEIVFPNNMLLNSQVQNLKRMTERRVVFTLGITYETSPEKLSKVPQLIKGIIATKNGSRFERTHFKNYGDFALIFEVVYWVRGNDFQEYMDIQHAINSEIFEVFAREGLNFAYPTQTIYVNKMA